MVCHFHCDLSSIGSAIGRAGLGKEVELLRPEPNGSKVPNGTVMCQGNRVPKIVTLAMRTAVLLVFITCH